MEVLVTNNKDGNFSSKYRGFIIIGLIIGFFGVLACLYSISHHLEFKEKGSTDSLCNVSEKYSCDAIAASEYSEILGTPLGVWGLGYFIGLIWLLLAARFLPKYRKGCLYFYHKLALLGGLACLFLIGISLLKLNALCPSCMVIYVLCFSQFFLVIKKKSLIPNYIELKPLLYGVFALSTPTIILFASYHFYSYKKEKDLFSQHQAAPKVSSSSYDIPINKSKYSGLGEDYRIGNDEAKVVIVEFSDFECPSCKTMGNKLKTLVSEYGDKISVVLKNFPLDQKCNHSLGSPLHYFACDIATLARCAGQYGKFWEYHDLAFAEQQNVNAKTIRDWASRLGLTNEQIEGCLSSKGMQEKIKDDISLGLQLGVNGTPTVFINGKKLLDNRLPIIRAEINNLLSSP